MDDRKILVGDVGGTHARFAIVDASTPPFAVGARAELSFAVENIEAKYRLQLEEWDGEAHSLRGIADTVHRVLEVL